MNIFRYTHNRLSRAHTKQQVLKTMETIFPLNSPVQQLTSFLTTDILFAMSASKNKRRSVEEFVTEKSQQEVKLVTEHLQYTHFSHLQFAHFLAVHLLREEDRREHSNWVEHVETNMLSRLQNRLHKCMLQSDPDIGEVYFLEDVISSLNRWIAIQKDDVQVRQRAFAEANVLNIDDLHSL